VGIVAHVQGADVELQLGLLAKTFIAVSTRVATPLMHFANVPTHVPGALELLVTLGTGIALADVLGLVVQLPGAAIDEFGEAQGAAEPALLMHDFAMPRQHDLRGKETRRRTIGTLITKTLMIALPVLSHRTHGVILSTVWTRFGNFFLAQMHHTNVRVEHSFVRERLLTSVAESGRSFLCRRQRCPVD